MFVGGFVHIPISSAWWGAKTSLKSDQVTVRWSQGSHKKSRAHVWTCVNDDVLFMFNHVQCTVCTRGKAETCNPSRNVSSFHVEDQWFTWVDMDEEVLMWSWGRSNLCDEQQQRVLDWKQSTHTQPLLLHINQPTQQQHVVRDLFVACWWWNDEVIPSPTINPKSLFHVVAS